MTGNKKLQVWLPLIFSLILITGMYFGFRLRENSPAGSRFFKADKKNTVQEIMDLVNMYYVDSVQSDSLQYDAIQEMISHLDPHSVYIPASQLKEANEDITGNFEGIGIEFNIFNDTIHVLYVLPGGPGEKAGMQVGDCILKIDEKPAAGVGITSNQIRERVRGRQGTKVNLVLQRNKKEISVTVTRGTIPLPAVDAAYMLTDSIGYIRLNKFSESAYREFMEALESLQKSGMKNLVFDLRGNGGGLMDQAVSIADEFLSGDKLIVYTEGVNSKRRNYRCRRNGLFEDGPLVLLVDELSASASEVVAGALQDWCRATIIGRRTFGKGLVQEQYSLRDGSAIRLTVARYYTPISRSIQRPYEKGKAEYLQEVRDRFYNGESLSPDSAKTHYDNGKIYKTECGDTVYGGGGIMPDIFVPADTAGFSQNIRDIVFSLAFNNLIYNFYISNRASIEKYRSVNEFADDLSRKESTWQLLTGYALRDSVDLKKASPAERQRVMERFLANLARYRWRNSGFNEIINKNDPVVKRALAHFTKKQ